MDLDDTVSIQENDDSFSDIDTDIESEDTLVKTSYEIDQALTQEQEAGYSWDEPLAIVNPYQISPLTAVVLFDTDQAVSVRFTVKGKTENADISGQVDAATSHRIPIVGLYPSYDNTVVLELLDDDGNVTDTQEITITTDSLPDKLSDVVEPVTTSGQSAYGLTMVYGQDTSMPFAYDCMGDIRWYMNRETANYGLYFLSNGRMIVQDTGAFVPSLQKPQSNILYEMDYLGRAYNMYYIPGGNHHEVIEKEEGGNLLVLSSSMDSHFEDEILEVDRDTGEIVNKLDLEEIFGNTYTDRDDWAHINTVSYQADGDTILISCRNVESVMKINWSTHKLQWILCDPTFWEGTDFEKYVLQPDSDFVYHYQQHSAYQLDTNLDGDENTVEISIFDNHYVAARKNLLDTALSNYENTKESYLTVYAVNENDMTVSQIKQIPVAHSYITSNTVYDSDSNHIFGMCGWLSGAASKDYSDRRGMTYEIDYDTEEIINQYSIKTKFYRASEMKFDYNDLASPMELSDNYIKGELWQSVKTSEKIDVPDSVLPDDVTFKFVGKVLYVKTLDHQISQIIFKGQNNTYVYDTTNIRLHVEDYLAFSENIPVPVENLASDTYEILCVYQGEFYTANKTFTVK